MSPEPIEPEFTPEQPKLEVQRHEPIYLKQEIYDELRQNAQLTVNNLRKDRWVNAVLRSEPAPKHHAIAVSAQVIHDPKKQDTLYKLILAVDIGKRGDNNINELKRAEINIDESGAIYDPLTYKTGLGLRKVEPEGFLTLAEIPFVTEVEDSSFVRQALNKIIRPLR